MRHAEGELHHLLKRAACIRREIAACLTEVESEEGIMAMGTGMPRP